jgi:hypothetical protein
MLVRPKHVCLMEMIWGVVGQRYRDKTPTMYAVVGEASDESFENGPAARALSAALFFKERGFGQRIGGQQACAHRETHNLGAGSKVEFFSYSRTICLNSFHADTQLARYVRTPVTRCDQTEHLRFSFAEHIQRAGVATVGSPVEHIPHEHVREAGIHKESASMHGSERRQQLRVNGSFQHIARSASGEHGTQVGRVIMHRQDEHARVGTVSNDLLEGGKPARTRHREIHERHVRSRMARLLNGPRAVSGFSHHFHVGLGTEQHLQPGAENGVIIDDQDPDSWHPA